jgi:cob(I)alamin adenosyltransferase
MTVNAIPSWFGFLRIEADLARSFIDLARSHSKPARSARSLGNARKALAEVQCCLTKPADFSGLSENEVAFLENRCTEIESALRAFVPGKQV